MKYNKARSFITIMLVIASVSLFLRFGIKGLIDLSIKQNESRAGFTLKLIASALENYARNNNGVYPSEFPVLAKSNPAYLDKDYIALSPAWGYNYSCPRLDAAGYSCSAIPTRCKLTGKSIFTVSTGSLLISESCDKKEKE